MNCVDRRGGQEKEVLLPIRRPSHKRIWRRPPLSLLRTCLFRRFLAFSTGITYRDFLTGIIIPVNKSLSNILLIFLDMRRGASASVILTRRGGARLGLQHLEDPLRRLCKGGHCYSLNVATHVLEGVVCGMRIQPRDTLGVGGEEGV